MKAIDLDLHSALSHLECGWCASIWPADQMANLCPDCARPLLARYDLHQAACSLVPDALHRRPANLWRYAEVLPVRRPEMRKTLGEGYTSLLHLRRLGEALGLKHLYAKDESSNPTNSFKARGLAVAVDRAAELGARALAIPTAGNAGSAMAAYAALHGLPAEIYAPCDLPPPFLAEMQALGADITLVDGLITDCGALVRAGAEEGRWFDVSTLKEPYRIEGKKTMGYELYEHFGGALPDVILYPTGGGTGLIGMWKAFEEMKQMGWPGVDQRPRMISVQSSGCAPVVRAWQEGSETATPWEGAATIADGLRVPAAVGDFLILRAVRESGGTAIAVDDDDIRAAMLETGRMEGLFVAPEAAATLVALRALLASDIIRPDERIVLFFTGGGLKYYRLGLPPHAATGSSGTSTP